MSGSNSDVDERVLRVSALVLTNAFLFHEILSRSEGDVDTLRQVMRSSDPTGEFLDQWDYIVDEIDYAPIFELASDVLVRLPSSPETVDAIEELVDGAIEISGSRAALRHDLMGRMFHRLIANPKYYGARYTKIPAANTLMKLTTDEMDYNWEDPEEVQSLNVVDLACGTGTLLKSTLGAVLDQYIETAVEQGETAATEDVHAEFVEDGIWGFDVLPSAVHLAATGLALHDPDIQVDNMRIYALPLGGPSNRLGSIDFARDQRFLVQQTLMGDTAFSAEQAIEDNNTTDGENSIELPDYDVVTMNPPFTRNVYDSFLYGDLDEDERQDLMSELRDVRDSQGLEANLRPGIGTVFVALADRVVNSDGILSFVLPKTLLSGSDWDKTRDIIDNYNLRYVLSSHEAGNWNFSEDTDLSETMIVADGTSDEEGTYYINLWKQPRAYAESLSLSNLVSNADVANLEGRGVAELKTDSQKYGEIIKSPTQEEELPWGLPAAFAQSELVRSGYYLLDGIVYIPGRGEVAEIQMVNLSDRATLGPDGRDIYDAFNTTDNPTAFNALWGNISDDANSLSHNSNKYLSALSEPKEGRPIRDAETMWGRAGSLMLANSVRLNSNKTVSVVLPDKALSNVWWPTRWDGDSEEVNREMERRLALWLNSTLGLLGMLSQRQDTEGPFVKFSKTWWKSTDVLDLDSLDDNQLQRLDELWEEVSEDEVQSLPEMSGDDVREKIDDTFEDILGIEDLSVLRDFLSREPVITDEPII